MRIINTLLQLTAVFPDGCFCMDAWRSWQGQSDVGYYLGCGFVRWLERKRSLEEVARMSHCAVEESLLTYLAQ